MKELIAGSASLLSAWLLFGVLFSDKEDFFDCLRFWLTPDFVSFFRGEYWDDHLAEFKLFIWVALSGGIGYGVYSMLS